MPAAIEPQPVLPQGFLARTPMTVDVAQVVALVAARRELTRGSSSVDVGAVATDLVGFGSWTRRQVVVEGPEGRVVAWAGVHDRAAGRDDLTLYVDPALDRGEELALPLLAWLEQAALAIARARGVSETRLELLVDETNDDLRSWVSAHGHHLARTWLNMSRPVSPDEEIPSPRPGVTVRRVRTHELGDGTNMPMAEDLQTVHRMLEESFADHFNSYRESFSEFVQRLREDPGHRWDHWWLAMIDVDGEQVPGGALVSTVTQPDAAGVRGSYIDYIGVHRRARGRGVAKALLWTVIGDAAARGRNRVGLEVDDDSSTGADGIYRSMGWETSYVTQSWHKDLTL